MNTLTLNLNNNYLLQEEKTSINRAIIEEYAKHQDLAQASKSTYLYCLNGFMKWLEARDIEEVTQDTIIDFKNDLRGKMKSTSINTYLTAIKDLFKWLESKGFKNVARNIKKEHTERAFNKDILTIDQAKGIVNNIDTSTIEGLRAMALFKLLICTGLRECEVVRADIKDISTSMNTNILYVQGKGKKDKKDYVVLNNNAMASLQEYLKVRGAKSDEPLFTSLSDRNKGQRLTTRTIRKIIKDLFIQNGIVSDRITTHSTRHTAISLSIYRGANIQQAQAMARHTDPKTTMIYLHNLNRLQDSAESYLNIFE